MTVAITINTPVDVPDDGTKPDQIAMVFPQTITMPVNAHVDEPSQRNEMNITINTSVDTHDDEPETLAEYRIWVESLPKSIPFVDAHDGKAVGFYYTPEDDINYVEYDLNHALVGGFGGDIRPEWRVSLADDWTTPKVYDSTPYRPGTEMQLWDITIPGSWNCDPTTIMRKEHTIVEIPAVDTETLRTEAGFHESRGWQTRHKVAGTYTDFMQAARAFDADSEDADLFSEAGYAWENLDEAESFLATDMMRPWWN